ncbi:crossover junction endodeoxyribonuclease RuvC [Roseospira marina]|uniref:Crossover junction endodeoxyribonuclease RuvC n=1 Tax=Roseospira marina TaxID=140057 RepID=A0A5M6IA44_9PROT|nr:crossover junction endodeoxyribonuclease RuvC [Roseospira marina]KAA5605146.1 crossover junction endodeoxyribonuclease RuvC [Roseospira marina]MBB4314901.1 crossover junction endodeoxyribonuclease RuvC [Roseospira marina]MBB5087901.1 crossover junction endodeoxyribonuclease RuvC [Roseospira marina]
MRILGLDPGLRVTGWGIVEAAGNRLSHIADGVVTSDERDSLAARLAQLHDGVMAVIDQFAPAEAAVEETFVNRNPVSTLKLGQARGVVMLAPARCGLPVAEYTPNAIKKAVVGRGHAEKAQVELMVRTLLPGADPARADAADALAVAICHAHLRASQRALLAGTTR